MRVYRVFSSTIFSSSLLFIYFHRNQKQGKIVDAQELFTFVICLSSVFKVSNQMSKLGTYLKYIFFFQTVYWPRTMNITKKKNNTRITQVIYTQQQFHELKTLPVWVGLLLWEIISNRLSSDLAAITVFQKGV